MDRRTLPRRLVVLVVAVAAVLVPVEPATAATGDPATNPFYRYTVATPLESIAPGTVLRTRGLPYRLAGLPLPLRTTQLLFRTTGARGQATLGVTTVVRLLAGKAARRVVSYQSFYESLDPVDQPSSVIAGDVRTLARTYCDRGLDVLYREYPLSHIGSIVTWTPQAIAWVNARFAGRDAPQNCGSIRPGNPVEPLPMP